MEDFEQFKKDLKSLMQIPSVRGEKTEDAPFGEEVKKALLKFLEIAERMGFEVKNYDNYVGEISYGTGREIGVIGHVDVVPAGENWFCPPYDLSFVTGHFFGRGVADDKGPMLTALYALNSVKNSGLRFRRKIRMFVGTDEETAWEDIAYLKTKTTLPEFGFSPDGNFPVSYSEKGIVIVKVKIPKLKKFTTIKGGSVINAVPDYAIARLSEKLTFDQEFNAKKLGLKPGWKKVESKGKSAHGSSPELGYNAIRPLFEFMKQEGEDLNEILELFNGCYGITDLKSEQGNLTFSPDLIKEEDGEYYLLCDCRIPEPLTFDMVKEKLDKTNLIYTYKEKHPPLKVEKEGLFVNIMQNAYNTVMQKRTEPVSMCGSTFARAFSKGCAFGMEFPGVDSKMHNANERVSETEFKNAYEIYRKTFYDFVK